MTGNNHSAFVTKINKTEAAKARFLAGQGYLFTPAHSFLDNLTENSSVVIPTEAVRFDALTKKVLFPISDIQTGEVRGIVEIAIDDIGNMLSPEKRRYIDASGYKKPLAVVFERVKGSSENIKLVTNTILDAIAVYAALDGHFTVYASCGLEKSLLLNDGGNYIICANGVDDESKDWSTRAIQKNVLKHRGYAQVARLAGGETFASLGLELIRAKLLKYINNFKNEVKSTRILLKDATDIISKNEFDDLVSRKIEGALHIANITTGGGKSYQAIVNIIKKRVAEINADPSLKGHKIVYATQNGEFTRQMELDIKKMLGPSVRVGSYRSFESKNPDNPDELMCLNIDAVREARKVSADVEKEVCATCPLAKTCAFKRQQKELEILQPDVVIQNNHIMSNGKLPKPIRKDSIIDLIIVDENPQSNLIKNIEITKSQLTDPVDSIIQNDPERNIDLVFAQRIMQAIALTMAQYEENKVNASELSKAIFLRVDALSHNIYGNITERDLHNNLHGALKFYADTIFRLKITEKEERDYRKRGFNERVFDIVKFLRTLQNVAYILKQIYYNSMPENAMDAFQMEEYKAGREPIVTVTEDAICVPIVDINKKLADVPIIALDATADLNLVSRVFQRNITSSCVQNIEAPFATIVQDASRAYSMQFLQKESNISKIEDYIIRESMKAKKLLVVTNKKYKDLLVSRGYISKHAVSCEIAFAHFNNVAGMNIYSDFDVAVVIGRPLPPVSDVRNMIEACGGRHDDDNWHLIQREREIIDGGTLKKVFFEAMGSNCPIADAVLRQICDAQVVQAIGRLRQIRREAHNPCKIVILGDAVVPFPVQLMSQAEVDVIDDHKRIIERGFFTNNPAHESKISEGTSLTISLNTLTQRRAMQEKAGVKKEWMEGLVPFRYQQTGQGKRLNVGYYDPKMLSSDDVKAALEEKIGELVIFESDEIEPLPVELYDEDCKVPDAFIKKEYERREMPTEAVELVLTAASPPPI